MPAATKAITPESMKSLALAMIDFLDKKALYDSQVIVYLGHTHRITDQTTGEPGETVVTTPAGKKVFIAPYKQKLSNVFCNEKTLSVVFEGKLYDEMNEFGKLQDELNTMFRKYGLHLRMNTTWEFSLEES